MVLCVDSVCVCVRERESNWGAIRVAESFILCKRASFLGEREQERNWDAFRGFWLGVGLCLAVLSSRKKRWGCRCQLL